MNNSQLIANVKNSLEGIKGKTLSIPQRAKLAVELAGVMLAEARRCQTHAERRMQKELARMMEDSMGKVFAASMTDQCFRSDDPRRVADQLEYLIERYGVPHFLSPFQKALMIMFRKVGRPLAKVIVPLTKQMLRKQTLSLILPGEPEKLSAHLRRRRKEHVHINLNHLGEAILGETEAEHRLNTYLADIANPEVECISVKISSIYSQTDLLGWEDTLSVLSHRLKRLYRAAKEHQYALPDGRKKNKFVYLDMEEYRDLHLTVELFRRVLDEAEFFGYSAGIVLQSYLPDSYLIQQEVTAWAVRRKAAGAAPIKIRIVKGANLAMEKIEASLKEWPQAPYTTKIEVDANYKRMLHYGFEMDHAEAVNVGVASHNLFDIAYAMILRAEKRVEKYISFEMLEGMADHIRRVVQAITGDMLLYCPAAAYDEFQNAIAYLIRRLDENTAPENFLRHVFGMLPGSEEWEAQSSLFFKGCEAVSSVSPLPRRQQNRFNGIPRKDFWTPFENEPDTDWSLPQNRKWAESLLAEWSGKSIEAIPLVIGGEDIYSGEAIEKGEDPAFPGKELYKYVLADSNQLEDVLNAAVAGFNSWSGKPLRERMLLLEEVAHALRLHRRSLIGAMVADTGKTVSEADAEVSETIDFAEYYRRSIEEVHFFKDIRWTPKGAILIAPPWNFPCSIPAGGIIAALAAGNSVIFKPAPEAVLTGWHLANIMWEAGIDKGALQFFTCRDDTIGSRLVQDPRIAAVVLTGASATAKKLLKLRPGLDLIAETGGKNAIIISNMADRDLAIKNLVQSAFGYSGQKCSACSLAILVGEVYDDPLFMEKLRDAVASLSVGSQWNLSTRVTPLIREPNPTLRRGLTALEEGEAWLLKPRNDPANPNLWSPGVKIGVKQGGFTHQNELFGPVLAVMRADNLEHAVRLANSTPFGLTSGIQTLDEREQEYWVKHVKAGNCYINRGITGAIVQRQPFGGIKESCFGPGAKAGGPNYVMQFMHPEQQGLPTERDPLHGVVVLLDQQVRRGGFSAEDIEKWDASIGSYAFYWNHYFSKKHDPSRLLGQDNLLYYVPRSLVLRVQKTDSAIDVLRAIGAGVICGAAIELSLDEDQISAPLAAALRAEWRSKTGNFKVISETEEELIDRISTEKIRGLRLLSLPSQSLKYVLADAACKSFIVAVLADGRVELLRFLQEISLSADYHRYGNLGIRDGEQRGPVCENICSDSCLCAWATV